MGLPSLGYEDLYAPIVERADLQYTPRRHDPHPRRVRALGAEYVEGTAQGVRIAVGRFPAEHRQRPGAYSTMVYGVHPYQLLNYNGAWDDVSTLAHESGHSMHSYLSSANQPYATAGYSIFVAEVASDR